MELKYRSDIRTLTSAQNIAEAMTEEDLGAIGALCLEEFTYDLTARTDWDSWYAEAMKLALQVMEAKTFPWPNCSNVKFPLLTIAALNFHAKAYPTLINGTEVVQYRYIGEDKTGPLRAERISSHQNYQLLTAMDWEEHEDKALIVTPIMGCSFKKSFYDFEKKLNASRLILPQNLVVPYYTASLETTPRISEIFSLNKNAFLTRIRRGQFLSKEYSTDYRPALSAMESAKLQAQHQTPTPTSFPGGAPTEFIEQHRFLDLDGDKYEEPYIVTFVRATGQICRIVARYTPQDVEYVTRAGNREVVLITPEHYYTKNPFIPSPDGGFYDLGLGMLLGPLNYACDSLINQLIDAGTMQILGGGFLGRGVRIRRGESTFQPYEWKTVDSTGASLKDNIVPLPTREPAKVLLDLLMFLVSYGEKIGSSNEVQMGDIPGQNVKAETMQIANANGQRIFAAIYKRWWRAKKEEFQKLYTLTARNIQAEGAVGLRKGGGKAEDYVLPADGLYPSADPNVVSREEVQKTALLVFQTASTVPGQDIYKATMRLYKAHNVPNPEEIFPDPSGPNAIAPQPDVKMIDAQTKAQKVQQEGLRDKAAHILAVGELLRKIEESQAKIKFLLAQAEKAHAEAVGVPQGHAIALLDAQIGAEKSHHDTLANYLKILMPVIGGTTSGDQAAPGVGTGTDTGSNRVSAMESPSANAAVLSLSGGSTGGGEGAMGSSADSSSQSA